MLCCVQLDLAAKTIGAMHVARYGCFWLWRALHHQRVASEIG